MRVLWLCNVILPKIATELGLPSSSKEGWLTGLSDAMIAHQEENEITLGVCFPVMQWKEIRSGSVDGISFYTFYEDMTKEAEYSSSLEMDMRVIVADFKPDIVHVFGTEFGHSLAMAKSFSNPEKILIGIQGVLRDCAIHFADGIPEEVKKRSLFRDVIKQDNIAKQQEKFFKRAEREQEMLPLYGHITGRTDLDFALCEEFAPKAKYHFMNETLRSNFYKHEWKLEGCKRHSILVSQADYPLKGFHSIIPAIAKIKEECKDVTVRVCGNKITNYKSIKDKIKISSYGKYLRDLMEEYNVAENITFLGMVSAEKMCKEMLESHVFLAASAMENSPNSLGEAMLLGVPCVSSNVGGVPNLCEANKEGLLFEALDSESMANKVLTIFEEDELALKLSENAKERARKTHDAKQNYDRLIAIYHSMNDSMQ